MTGTAELWAALVEAGRSLFERGLTPGRTGNLSIRDGEDWLVTPTGVSLGRLDASEPSRVDGAWRHTGGPPPTKEVPVHAAMAQALEGIGAIVHLHSPHAVALSCLPPTGPDMDEAPFRVLTPYFVMKVGSVAWIPYHRPGDPALRDALAERLLGRHAALLANHGPVVAARDLGAALDAIEELEATARIELLLGDREVAALSTERIEELRRAY